jgi:uncharacterized protein (UPF0335 family)
MTQKSDQENKTSSLKLEIENYKITEENLKQSNLEMIEKMNKLYDENKKFNEKIKDLYLELERSLDKKSEYDKLIIEAVNKEKDHFQLKCNEYNMVISNLNQDLAEKDKIIGELKLRLMEYQKDKSVQKVSIQSKREETMPDEDSFNNYLNKSDDNIIFASEDTYKNNNRNLLKKLARYEVEVKVLKDKLKDLESFGSDLDLTKNKKNLNSSNLKESKKVST